jgi:hydroxymethyl cephem carbamoyltransferase
MLVVAFKPGHDGSIAVVKDHTLLYSLEAEKDSYGRHGLLSPGNFLEAAEVAGEQPDVVAISGWVKEIRHGAGPIGAGYVGSRVIDQPSRFFGKDVRYFSSSHERCHIMMSIGMAPKDDAPLRAVLTWEGILGAFYLVDDKWNVVGTFPVMDQPGARYRFIYALADPKAPFPAPGERFEDAGKLMALAAYGDPTKADAAAIAAVDRILDKRLPPSGTGSPTGGLTNAELQGPRIHQPHERSRRVLRAGGHPRDGRGRRLVPARACCRSRREG